MRTLTLLLVAAFLAAGCGKQAPKPSDAAAKGGQQPAATLAGATEEPGDVLVKVEGKKLTRGEVQDELAMRMTAVGDGVPPDRRPELQARMFDYIVDQFIMKTILLQEADRQKVKVTPEDEAQAFDRIAKQLPPGKTVEQIMKESPIGEKRMREELETGLRVEKLVAREMSNRVVVADSEIAALRESDKDRLVLPESVRARHILILSSTNEDAVARQAKKAKIEGIRKQVLDGASFEEMARANSDDKATRERGGDLGIFRRGQMVKPFEDAAFTQELDAVGPVIETRYGFHIVQVLEKTPGRALTDSEVAAIIQRKKRAEETRKLFQELRAKAKVEFGPTYSPPPSVMPGGDETPTSQ
jgi:peptidyl-prolyl cis-trans isomerase C